MMPQSLSNASTSATPVSEPIARPSTVYGPVPSWRFGQSLGIDLLGTVSTCSFNCIYCQLGDIRNKTMARGLFVATTDVLDDLARSNWPAADILTFSGSGEPTLALNLGQVLEGVKALTQKPVMVLTNGTLLHLPEVRQDLAQADHVAVKLDATTPEGLQQINRPVAGVTFEGIRSGIRTFRADYSGKLSLQCMFMPANLRELDGLIACIRYLQPDEVQLNTPKRPYPLQWVLESRGNHTGQADYPTMALKTISLEQALTVEQRIRTETGVPVLSVYPQTA